MQEYNEQADGEKIIDDALYWLGYVITYWCFAEELLPKEIGAKYNIKEILYAYEPLHTVEVSTAIDMIKEDYIND